MFGRKKKEKKDRFKSKYADLDIEGMPDEEFSKISNKVYMAIAVRSFGGIVLFILCIIALVLGGTYLW